MALSGKERMAAWRRKNPERAAAISTKSRAKHKKRLNEEAKLRARAWRKKNPDLSKKIQRDWYAANPTKRKEQQLRKYYKMSLQEFNRLREHQDNRCAVCGEEFGVPCVDHNHATGEIRGLLCHKCNHLIHRGKDSEDFFRHLINYINTPPARVISVDGLGELYPRR